MQVNADLHIHGPYSAGSSRDMTIPLMDEYAGLKGLQILATADCLHPKWLKHLKENLKEDNGLFRHKESKTRFLLETEVQDSSLVHELIFLPSFDAADSLYSILKKHSTDIDKDGRPRLSIGPEELAGIVLSEGGMIGPAHAFTPYYAIYSKFNSIKECYGKHASKIKFIELGLSADTEMADHIEELNHLTFLSNSDAHSVMRLGREFNQMELEEPSFAAVKDAIDNHKVTLNAGYDPREGKYHLTACNKCYRQYELKEAKAKDMRCSCGGIIKTGVKDRIIARSGEKSKSPSFRPEYKHMIPLIEIISKSLGISSTYSKKVQELWRELVEENGGEIKVLLEADLEKIEEKNKNVARAIKAFRAGEIQILPGGGGNYGQIKLPFDPPKKQKSLSDF